MNASKKASGKKAFHSLPLSENAARNAFTCSRETAA